MDGLKFFDCSACIGLGTVNRTIVNHEKYIVVEEVKQAKDAQELLDEMDFCGIERAVTYHQSMIDVAPDYGNETFLTDKSNYTGRLRGTITILPSISDEKHCPESIFRTIKENKLVGVRAFPAWNRYFLNRITMGDLLDVLCEKNVPIFLSPSDGWEHIFAVLQEFPFLTVIITNYGLWGSDRYFFPLIANYKNVYIDTSDYQVFNGINHFVDKFGSERLLFGTNYPMDNMGGSVATLLGAKIPFKDKENIAAKNIERLFGEIRI